MVQLNPSPVLNGGVLVCNVLSCLGRKRDDFAVELLGSSRKIEDCGSDVGVAGDGVDGLALCNSGAADGERDVDISVWQSVYISQRDPCRKRNPKDIPYPHSFPGVILCDEMW